MNTPLFQWVNENNPSSQSQWLPGFWNYIEFIYRINESYPDSEITVIGTYLWETPEPIENLCLPVFRLYTEGVTVAAKNTMFMEPFYVVAATSEVPFESTFGLASEFNESRMCSFEGIPEDLRFPKFSDGCRHFTATVKHDLDLFALIRILTYRKDAEQGAAANP